jgi:hypothetical protein
MSKVKLKIKNLQLRTKEELINIIKDLQIRIKLLENISEG